MTSSQQRAVVRAKSKAKAAAVSQGPCPVLSASSRGDGPCNGPPAAKVQVITGLKTGRKYGEAGHFNLQASLVVW